MKFLQEITDWDFNHLYVTDDAKSTMYAYMKNGSTGFFVFSKPIKFSTSGRKFREVPNTFGFHLEEAKEPGAVETKVLGSKGELYIVTELKGNYSCTCTGFKFRSKCKHIESVK
jgi:hypothetical protein